ncbi:MAG TPA: MFS transporter [Ktedonobacterales bacterium]|nr:MFS transporter [Ktedonobacterales bacterium]
MLATLRNRNFALVWLGGFISLAGDWLLMIGLPIYTYTLTHSALATGVMFMASALPQMLLASVAGVFVDRWDRRRTMIVFDLLLAAGLIPLLFVHSKDTLWLVYVVAVVEGILSQFYAPAESAILPTLVASDQLISANSLNALNKNLARLVGPALGGLVVAAGGLGAVTGLDAISFVAAALLVAFVRFQPQPAVQPEPAAVREPEAAALARAEKNLWREWREGLRLIPGSRVLKVYLVIFAAMGLGEGIISVLLVVFALKTLRGQPELLGLMMSAQAIGGLLGSLIVAPFGKRVSPYRLLGVCAFLFGLVDLIIVDAPAFVPHTAAITLVLALFVVVGIPSVGLGIGMDSGLQLAVPNEYLGRLVGLATALMSLLMLVGMALASTLGDRVGAVPLLNGQGGMYALSGLLVLFTLGGVKTAQRPAGKDAGQATDMRAAAEESVAAR